MGFRDNILEFQQQQETRQQEGQQELTFSKLRDNRPLPKLVSGTLSLQNTPEHFRAGEVALSFGRRKAITSDIWILDTIAGYQIELVSEPVKHSFPKPTEFINKERKSVEAEINSCVRKL